jgi:hypothetical protein
VLDSVHGRGRALFIGDYTNVVLTHRRGDNRRRERGGVRAPWSLISEQTDGIRSEGS